MFNRRTEMRSILLAAILALMPAQQLFAAVGILNVQPGTGGKPIARSLIKETVVGERFETREKEILELVLSDGTSLTLGPGSSLTIESFSYDPQTQSGQLNVRLEHGQFRIVGGLLNNTGNIVVQTPTGKLDLNNAAIFVDVQANGATRASLLHGKSLKLTTNGTTETVERPAFEVITTAANQPPKGASQQDPKVVAADVLALDSASLAGEEGGGVGDPGSSATLLLTSLSGLANETPVFNATPNSGGAQFTRPTPIGGALDPSDGFGPGALLGAPDLDPDQGTRSTGGTRSLAQNRVTVTKGDLAQDPAFGNDPDSFKGEATRFVGATTNRIFNSSEPFTQTVDESDDPNSNGKIITPNRAFDREEEAAFGQLQRDTNLLQYVFFVSGNIVALDAFGDESRTTHIGVLLASGSSGINVDAPIVFPVNIFELKEPGDKTSDGKKITKFVPKTVSGGDVLNNSMFGDAQYSVLQTGFSREILDPFNEIVIRVPDNFILVQIRPAVGSQLDPNRQESFLFATGDVDGRLNPNFKSEFSVDRYFISPGLEGFGEGITTEQPNNVGKVVSTGETIASSIRAFLRNETKLGIRLTDSGLLVINPKSSNDPKVDREADSALVHADFGLEGTGAGQKSTISVTLGKVDYKSVCSTGCDISTDTSETSYEAVGSGRTIGSSHDNTDRNPQTGLAKASVLFSSRLDSTAAGGGNPLLPGEGKAGYFVLENVDPGDPTFEIGNPNSGGFEKPLDTSGGQNDTQYAYLRLATAIGSSKPTLRSESTLNGWMGSLAEFQNGNTIGLTQLDSGDAPSNVEILTNPTNNTLAANFTLFGQNPNLSTTFNLGGLTANGASAFVDDNRFAARSTNNGSEVAMVTADLFRDANGNLPASLNLPNGTSIPQYEHLKWGFFFGDTKTTPGQREHVHLGTWIAGKIPTGDSLGLRGTATYSGHSIGNVFNNGSVYTAVGTFENQWNFDRRRGSVKMDFDQTAYTGTTAIKGSSFNFDGSLTATGRTGGLQGSFVAPVNPTPSAVMGRFSIAETPGAATYRASGSFGGQRK